MTGPLQLPDWVPSSVADAGPIISTAEDGDQVRLRLLTDPRMETVWRTIGRGVEKQVNGGRGAQFATRLDQYLKGRCLLDPKMPLVERAQRGFFSLALIEFALANPFATRSEMGGFARRWRDAAALNREARLLIGRALFDRELAASLARAAEYCDEIAAEIDKSASDKSNPYVMERSTRSKSKTESDVKLTNAIRARIKALAKDIHPIFGEYMCGTLAVVSVVATGTHLKITEEIVRDWCAELPVPISAMA